MRSWNSFPLGNQLFYFLIRISNYAFPIQLEILNQFDRFTTTTLQTISYRLIQIWTAGRHGGGIEILISLDTNLLTSTCTDCNTNWEILHTTITYNTSIIILLLIYRLPTMTTIHFSLTLLNLYLVTQHILTWWNSRTNFHFDSDFKQYLIFKRLNLTQHINLSTHSHWHTLDIRLTLSSSNLINRITQSTLLIDHYVIDCHINITVLFNT